jgi:hypothetical protein
MRFCRGFSHYPHEDAVLTPETETFTKWIRWVGPRRGLNDVKNRNISCPWGNQTLIPRPSGPYPGRHVDRYTTLLQLVLGLLGFWASSVL